MSGLNELGARGFSTNTNICRMKFITSKVTAPLKRAGNYIMKKAKSSCNIAIRKHNTVLN